jgi:hypothetical protein
MNKPASLLAGVFLIFVACMQFIRFVLAAPITIGTVEIPAWPSLVAAILTGVLGFWVVKERKRGTGSEK